MPDSVKDLTVRLAFEHGDTKSQIAAIKNEIKLLDSGFKAAALEAGGLSQAMNDAAARGGNLQQQISLMEQAIKKYGDAISKANGRINEAKQRQQDYAAKLSSAKAKQADLTKEIERVKAAMEASRAATGENTEEYANLSAELQNLQSELQATNTEVQGWERGIERTNTTIANSEREVQRLSIAQNDARTQLSGMRSEMDSLNNTAEQHRQRMEAAGRAMQSYGDSLKNSTEWQRQAGKELSKATAAIVSAGVAAAGTAIQWETSMADVRKTVSGTAEQLDTIEAGLMEMSQTKPIDNTTLAGIAANAGQLGIWTDNVLEFTDVMSDLANTTNLTAEEGASAFAKFANITGMAQTNFSRLGSVVVDLGNNMATTESDIVAMGTNLASAGRQLGMSEADIMGIAAALSSLGLEAQAGGTAFSKMFVNMKVAAETGSDDLKQYAAVAGMTAEQFKTALERDAAGAVTAFVTGLGKGSQSAIVMLDEMGITETRFRDALLRASNASEMFTNSLSIANGAWKENSALAREAAVRYGTTASKMTTLGNKAKSVAVRFGQDLLPMVNQGVDFVGRLLEKFESLDEGQRKQILTWGAYVAAIGPTIGLIGKLNGAVAGVAKGIGSFTTAIASAGGGMSGLMSAVGGLLGPVGIAALIAGVAVLAYKFYDWASGAKAAREALKALDDQAKDWKETMAQTFYNQSEGLNLLGMSASDFTRDAETSIKSAKDWKNGLVAVWSDGEKETDDIVSKWTESWKELSGSTRDGLKEIQATASERGYTGLGKQIESDIQALDAADKEIEALLKKRQNGYLTDAEKIRLDELVDTRNTLMVKYALVPDEGDSTGFDTLREKVEAEVARATARGEGVSEDFYQAAVVGAAEGMAAINQQLDDQYAEEYKIIQLIEDADERKKAQADLDKRYNADRLKAAQDYADVLKDVIMPVWSREEIQDTQKQVGNLGQFLTKYSTLTAEERKMQTPALEAIMGSFDEGTLTEYVGMLTQIQSLLDSGMSESDVQALFPDIDFSKSLEELAAIQTFLNENKWDTNLKSVNEMFGDALGEEVLKIATDLDMTGAQARWAEWAANPGAITTDAVVQSYSEKPGGADKSKLAPEVAQAMVAAYAEATGGASTTALTPEVATAVVNAYIEASGGASTTALAPEVAQAVVDAYTEATGGASVAALTPEVALAMVNAYAEATGGASVAALTPEVAQAMVNAYAEITGGASVTKLTPEVATAVVNAYIEASGGASTTALTPEVATAVVNAFIEATGGASVTALTPEVAEAMVKAYAEAKGIKTDNLLPGFVATITSYQESPNVVKPTLGLKVGLTGYDLLSYLDFVRDNQVTVTGIVRLSDVYEDPNQALDDPTVHFWKDGVEIPATAVPKNQLTGSDFAVYEDDGTMHVFVTAELTGTPEAIEEMKEAVEDTGLTDLGAAVGIPSLAPLDLIDSAISRMAAADEQMKSLDDTTKHWWDRIADGTLGGSAENVLSVLDQSMQNDFSPEKVAQLSTYVGEIVTAIQNGEDVGEEDLANLQKILDFTNELDAMGIGQNVTAGIKEGLEATQWDGSASTVSEDLTSAINTALGIASPAKTMIPVGDNVAAGIAQGMTEYAFAAAAASVMGGITGAFGRMRGAGQGIGDQFGAGLASGLRARLPGIVAEAKRAAEEIAAAFRDAWQIHSPSKVAEGLTDMFGRGLEKGMDKWPTVSERLLEQDLDALYNGTRRGSSAGVGGDTNTYTNSAALSFAGANFYVRDQQDVQSLAVDIATLTKRKQHGKGLRAK